MRRTQCTPISASIQALHLAKLNLSSITKKTVISFLIEIFRCFVAVSTPSYAPNAVHADFSVETSSGTRKTQSSLDVVENYVILFLIKIFRRLNTLPTPFYAANAAHADFSVNTRPASRKTQSFFAFYENCYFVLD
jgi:hypothetical protein